MEPCAGALWAGALLGFLAGTVVGAGLMAVLHAWRPRRRAYEVPSYWPLLAKQGRRERRRVREMPSACDGW